MIASAHALEPGGRFKRRRFLPWNVADDEGKLVLIGPGGDLDFKAEDGDALELALSGAPFSAADLLCELPKSWSAPFGRRASSSASPSFSAPPEPGPGPAGGPNERRAPRRPPLR